MKNRTLNILYIAHERKLGGATISLLALIDEMIRRGHEVKVVVPTKKCPLALELKKRNICIIPVFFAWWQMPSDWNVIFKLLFKALYILEKVQVYYVWKKVRACKVDIIHTNSSVTDFGARLAGKLDVKHVWHVREFGDTDYNLEYIKGKRKTWEYMNDNSDRIVFISHSLQDYFKEYASNKKRQVIYNGISREYLYERNYQDKKTKVTFLIAGNLNRNKRQMLVLQAANELIERGIFDFKVLIAGASSSMKDSQIYEEELKQYIKEKLPENVQMLGKVEDMRQLRTNADVEIVPSNREAFGRVTIEAMFGGMPVIGSDSGANVELIQDEVNGVIFENGNYHDLAEKMLLFINDQSKISEMGKHAYEYAKNNFTAERNASEIEQLYYELVGAK